MSLLHLPGSEGEQLEARFLEAAGERGATLGSPFLSFAFHNPAGTSPRDESGLWPQACPAGPDAERRLALCSASGKDSGLFDVKAE